MSFYKCYFWLRVCGKVDPNTMRDKYDLAVSVYDREGKQKSTHGTMIIGTKE